MGKMTMSGSVGGTGSDECTAKLSDIPAGMKAVAADSNDEAGVGTMTMTGNAQAGHVLAGETFYTNNYKTKNTGTMPVQAARTITPGASAQTVAAGQYLAGAITVPGFAMPAANLIKKGTTINIYGRTVTGTYEGYYIGPNEIYNQGVWGSYPHTLKIGISGKDCLITNGTQTMIHIETTIDLYGKTAIVYEGNNFTISGSNISKFQYENTRGSTITVEASSKTANKCIITIPENVKQLGAVRLSLLPYFTSGGTGKLTKTYLT